MKSQPKKVIIEKPTNRNKKAGKEKGNWFKSSIKVAWAVYSFLVTLLGFSLYSLFTPKLELIQSSNLNPKEALMTIMVVKNNSDVFSFKKVHPILVIDIVKMKNGSSIVNMKYDREATLIPVLKKGESAPFNYDLSNLFTSPSRDFSQLTYANIAYRIDYDFLFFHRSETFYYRATFDRDGNAVWLPLPEQDYDYEKRMRDSLSNTSKDSIIRL